MKKLMAVLSFLLVLTLLLAPMTATLAQAWGTGSGSGSGSGAGAGAPSGGSSSGSGSSSGASSSGASSSGAGAPAGAGSPSGAAAGAPASSAGTGGGSPSSMGGSPSASPAVGGATFGPRLKTRASKGAVVAPAETSSVSTTPSAAVAGDWQGRHTMTGEVTKINQRKGTFSLKTADGTLDLHAPPDVLANVKKGDQMAVEIAVRPLP